MLHRGWCWCTINPRTHRRETNSNSPVLFCWRQNTPACSAARLARCRTSRPAGEHPPSIPPRGPLRLARSSAFCHVLTGLGPGLCPGLEPRGLGRCRCLWTQSPHLTDNRGTHNRARHLLRRFLGLIRPPYFLTICCWCWE